MERLQLAPGIIVYSNVMQNHASLITDIEEGMKSAGVEWGVGGTDRGIDKKVRDTDSIGVPYIEGIDENFVDLRDAFNKSLANLFYETLVPLERQYMADHAVMFENHDAYQVLKYGKGQHFSNHVDDCAMYLRRVSSVFYLNDDYEGGKINFPRFGITYKPKANEFLVFPSSFIYNHSVSEVTNGTRYAVVSWIN